MKRVPGIVAALAIVIAASGGSAAVAASPQPPVPVRPVYLALGDSMAAGQNSAAPADLDAYWRTVDQWKRNGYVTPFAKFLQHELDCLPEAANASEKCGQLDVLNLARSAVPPDGEDPGLPGVTAQAVIDEQLEDAEDLIAARNGDEDPRNDVKIITLTVGGNEIFDAFRTGDPAVIAQAIGMFAEDYTQILGRLRAAAPGVPILTMTYFNPLRYCDTGLPPELVEPVATQADGVLTTFNGVIAAISGAFGAVPADTFGQLGEGDFFDCKHPNPDGYEDVTAAFEHAWAQVDN
jgi:lysophospholipase L1-like esterase